MEYTSLTPEQFAALEGLDDWRFVLGAIHANFRAGSFGAAVALATTIAAAADELVHHPDIDVRYPDRVHVALTTHATGGLTTLDAALARVISAAAAAAGATAEPLAAQAVEIAIDTLDADRIRPFWAAILGYPDTGGSLVDPLVYCRITSRSGSCAGCSHRSLVGTPANPGSTAAIGSIGGSSGPAA